MTIFDSNSLIPCSLAMRYSTACLQCRSSKRRCVRENANQDCAPCRQRRLVCEGHSRRRRLSRNRDLAPHLSIVKDPSSSVFPEHCICQRRAEPLLSLGTSIDLVDQYLDKFHGRPHSILHPVTLQAQIRDSTVSRALLYAICAIGCKFSGNPDIRAKCLDLVAQSKRLLEADISNVCLENIQTCILIAMLSVGHGDSISEALFFRIASAMAEIMDLNSFSATATLLNRETRHRLWWSIYMTDMWCMSGQGLHSQMKDIEIKIGLPIDDTIFASLQPDQSKVDGTSAPGLWAEMIKLVPNFRLIHNLNRLVARNETSVANLDDQVDQLLQKLESWKCELPDEAQMSQETLSRLQRKGQGGVLISIHLTYHYFSMLIHFRYLELRQTDDRYIARCKYHASSFSHLLSQSRQLKGCEVLYPNIGHMAVVSSSVLVHTLLFGELNEVETARQQLNANFEALVELSRYWPATSALIERLLLFQDMCLLSTEPGTTHKIDGWMLRFLIEHSLDIKSEGMLEMGSAKMQSKIQDFSAEGRYTKF